MSGLNKKQQLAKKRLLEQIKKEIKQIQFDIEHSKVTNFKMALIRNTKISLGFCRMIAPYVLTAGITFGATSLIGDTPFVRDDVKKTLEIKKTMDSRGNIRCEEQYDEYARAEATLRYIGSWQSSPDGFYERETRTYLIGKVSEKTILELLEKNDFTSLDDLFGRPTSVKNEIRNNLSEEELAEGAYLEAVTYSKDNSKYIVVKQDASDNLGLGCIWLLITLFIEMLPASWLSEHGKFYFRDYVDEVREDYPRVDVECLKKKLAIKQSNYERMTR